MEFREHLTFPRKRRCGLTGIVRTSSSFRSRRIQRGHLTGSVRFVEEIEQKIEGWVEFRGQGRPMKSNKLIRPLRIPPPESRRHSRRPILSCPEGAAPAACAKELLVKHVAHRDKQHYRDDYDGTYGFSPHSRNGVVTSDVVEQYATIENGMQDS